MGGFGTVGLSTRRQLAVDLPALCTTLRRMHIGDPINRVVWWRYPGKTLQRLRRLGARAESDPSVWDDMCETGDLIQFVFHKDVPLGQVPELVKDEPCWELWFGEHVFDTRLTAEWLAVPQSIRGGANTMRTRLTVGPHVLAVPNADYSDYSSVRVVEASFNLLFSGYPASDDSLNAMKSLPSLQLIRQHLEPVLGPLEIEATWSF
jgi:hypothetical protein